MSEPSPLDDALNRRDVDALLRVLDAGVDVNHFTEGGTLLQRVVTPACRHPPPQRGKTQADRRAPRPQPTGATLSRREKGMSEVSLMAIFGFYFVNSLLREMGWPRKQGLFKGEAFDTAVVDKTVDQMVDWGAAIGAGRPWLALQVIAELFRDRDWDGDNAPQIQAFIEKARETWGSAANPVDIVQPVRLTAHFGSSMSPKQLADPRIRTALEQVFLEALLWGFANPDQFGASYKSRAQAQDASRELAQKSGLDVGPPSSLSQFFENSESILRDYEREIGPLPGIPPRLRADAEALGRTVTD